MQATATTAGSGIATTHQASDSEPVQQPAPGLEDHVRAMVAGDQTAFSRLYEQTVGQIFAIARGMLRSREDAEEIVCDVYCYAWQRANTYDPTRGSVMAWLAIMTRNRSVDRLRQRRDAISLDDERYAALALSLTGLVSGPEQLLCQFESGSAVHHALSSLTPQRRQLLGMAFFDGLSHQEIADAMGLPLGTVKSHLRRALAALQSELAVDT